jgi:hypothetical protein
MIKENNLQKRKYRINLSFKVRMINDSSTVNISMILIGCFRN